jgi:catechol 2,3-dioxygenase-like lactoylglutathione lyase family enzyme
MKKIILSVLVIVSYCCYIKADIISVDISSVNNHVCIVVNDLNKVIPFYRDVLGFRVVDSGIRTGEETGLAFGVPNVKFKIYKAFSPNSHFYIEIIQYLTPKTENSAKNSKITNLGFNHFGIEVTDVEKAYKLIASSVGKAMSRPVTLTGSDTRMFFACDPEGNRIEIFKRKQQN